MFRGLHPRIVPLSERSNEKVSDLEGQGNILSTQSKGKGRIGDPTWVRSLAFAAPPMTQAVPLLLINLPPTTTSCCTCPRSAVCVPLQRTTKIYPRPDTDSMTISKDVLEPSSDWPQGETTQVCPKNATVPPKRTSKVHPALARESELFSHKRIPNGHSALARAPKSSINILLESSSQATEGEVSEPGNPSKATSQRRRSSKVHPALARESQMCPQKRASKVHSTLARVSKTSLDIASDPFSQRTEGEASRIQGIPVCSGQATVPKRIPKNHLPVVPHCKPSSLKTDPEPSTPSSQEKHSGPKEAPPWPRKIAWAPLKRTTKSAAMAPPSETPKTVPRTFHPKAPGKTF
ncbi:uncharacterized protein LOC127564049 [Antechinus flavipes]|uniref:uncharacterized protein LOC127564049 n=1 Tax=Antechinus flavipes TaxID=38775 RepID=UPI0022354AF4|nr:uncharacterized protein LOC127564049 [Antechinus flavipes]